MATLNNHDLLTLAAVIDAESVRIAKHKPSVMDVIRFLRSDNLTEEQIVASLADLVSSGHLEARFYGGWSGYAALRLGRSVFPIGIFDRPHPAKARKHARLLIAQREAA